jgi:cell division protein FtsB
MNIKISRNIKLILFFLFLFFAIGIILFNDYGLLKHLSLQRELKSLNEQIDSVENANKLMKAEIDSLEKKIPAKIEKIAREKYHMGRPGEKVIEVKEE